MINGTIKFFNAGKGFGFITPDGGGNDVFVPHATLSASGITHLKPGQRVLFEQAPDLKGPKAVKLQLLGEKSHNAASPASSAHVTVYCDHSSDLSADVLEAIRAAGYQPELVDYITTPLSYDQLRRLSHLLNEVDQSLVRRYVPLFLELQLDDRFLGDVEFWTAIIQHPTLINGPVLVFAGKARVCKSPDEVRRFLRHDEEGQERKPKGLTPRMAAMLKGHPVAAVLEKKAPKAELPVQQNPEKKARPAVVGTNAKRGRTASKKPAVAKTAKKKKPIAKSRKK